MTKSAVLEPVRMSCPVCERRYKRSAAQARSGKKTTCSLRCSYILRGRQRITRQSVSCAKCGTLFEKQPCAVYKNNFCRKCKDSPTVPYPTGHRCGRWTVLSPRVVIKKGKHYFQHCRCVCGAEHYVRKSCLNPNVVKPSLGCRQCGQKTQQKTLPKESIERQLASGARTWAAIAENLSVSADVVRKSISRHGFALPQGFGGRCPTVAVRPGDTFGRWTVLDEPFTRCSPRGTPLRYAKCKCQCGVEKEIRLPHLTDTRSTQCRKCLGKEARAANSAHWKGNDLISGTLLNVFRTGAKLRDLDWTISNDDMSRQFERQKGRCALSGVRLTLPSRDYSREDGCGIHYEGNASLDRIDSTKGYTTANIQWVEKTVNLMKRDFTEGEFIGLCCLATRRKRIPKETAHAFEQRFLRDLWNPKKREGIYSPRWKGCGGITGNKFHIIRAGAKSRGIEFRLTCSQLWQRFVAQCGRCAISGLPLMLQTKNSDTMWNASLDRIDSQKPYTHDNVWWVVLRINLMKRELPLQEVLVRCRRVARHKKSKGNKADLSAIAYKHGFRRR